MNKVIEDIVKIADLKDLSKEDRLSIENYVNELQKRFVYLEELQNKVMSNKEKFKNFTKLV